MSAHAGPLSPNGKGYGVSKFIISCGGTGGHLSPGIALAESLISQGHICMLLVSEKQVDSRLIRKYPALQTRPLAGAFFSLSPLRFVKFVVKTIRGIKGMSKILKDFEPQAVIAFGGFLSLPVLSVARWKKTTIILHEANRVPGKATRMFRKAASRVYLPRGLRLRGVKPDVIRDFGFPVRKEFRKIGKDRARQNIGMPKNGKLLVILGGSQGAQALNEWARDHFEQLAGLGVHIYCVTGMGQGITGRYEREFENGPNIVAEFVNFTDQMADVMSAADLIVTRAGAGTLAELVRCRTPGILVPYPFAADNHQDANARFFEQQGGGIVLGQESIGQLFAEVEELLFNDWLLSQLQRNLSRMDDAQVLQNTVDDLEKLVLPLEEQAGYLEKSLGRSQAL